MKRIVKQRIMGSVNISRFTGEFKSSVPCPTCGAPLTFYFLYDSPIFAYCSNNHAFNVVRMNKERVYLLTEIPDEVALIIQYSIDWSQVFVAEDFYGVENEEILQDNLDATQISDDDNTGISSEVI